jgi:hypothetical protein
MPQPRLSSANMCASHRPYTERLNTALASFTDAGSKANGFRPRNDEQRVPRVRVAAAMI